MSHSGSRAASDIPSCPSRRQEDRPSGILNKLGPVLKSGSDETRGVTQTAAARRSWDSNAADQAESNGLQRNGLAPGPNQHCLPTLLDIENLARSLGISMRQVRRFVADGSIPFIRIGHLIRFDPEEIKQWIEGRRCGTQRGG
jgi:excisionase family DNA binding protein